MGPVTSGHSQKFQNIPFLPGIKNVLPSHYVNKPGKFQLSVIDLTSFYINLFSVRSKAAAKLPLFFLNFCCDQLFSSSPS